MNERNVFIAIGIAAVAGVIYAMRAPKRPDSSKWIPHNLPPVMAQPPPIVVQPPPIVVQPPPVAVPQPAPPQGPLGDSWQGGGGASGPGNQWQQGGSEGGYGTKIEDDDDKETAWKS